MFALIYLFVSVMLGDLICRRFYDFVSLPHRLAVAFLSGLLISTWATYLCAYLCARSSQPLLWGNIIFFAVSVGAILWLRQNPSKLEKSAQDFSPRLKTDQWDLVLIVVFTVFAGWQMFSTFGMSAGKVQIANHQWSDFGSTVSIMQGFALGHNFPTEYPHFAGERIRYHFLYYFQAGNLEFLGLNPALSNNLLSILTLVAMLVLVMTLGSVLFRSRVVGRIGAILFFFHGSLAYIPFFRSHPSIGDALAAAFTMRDFLPSGFTNRGELWGVWSQVVFLNQRHLASSIGMLLIVLIFLAIRYQRAEVLPNIEDSSVPNSFERESETVQTENPPQNSWFDSALGEYAPFIFSGFLLGLMPLWNSAVFVAAAAVLGVLFLIFPLRKQMFALGAAAALAALPQVIFLKTGNVRPAGYSLFHWGYTVEDPTISNIVHYLGFTFGFKWLLIAVALFLATKFQRKIMLAVSVLIALAFCFQFSDEVLANHKFLNVWLVVANLYVAFGLYSLWNAKFWKSALPGKIAAVVLTVMIIIGGLIDLLPIRNGYWMEMPFEDDQLVSWVREQTEPQAIFLSHRFVNHGILLAGRRVFYGHPYYAWSAGYATFERDEVYKKLFAERNPEVLLRMLHENKIGYVAIDDQVRKSDLVVKLNEAVYKSGFELVFEDTEKKYDALAIYKVPAKLREGLVIAPDETENNDVRESPVNAFVGGQGRERGKFEKPRGIAADADGNFYVADLGNARVQKFSSAGEFLQVFGKSGTREGELREPNGITLDAAGDIYIADALNHRLLKFKPDGTFIKQWNGPEPGFYGVRDVAVAEDNRVFVLDQGRSRVVAFDPQTEKFTEWGKNGSGAGEFRDPTGLTIGKDRVFVTDAGNNRIQVFDLGGKFINQWEIPEWDKYLWHYPDAAFDAETERLYVTSGWTNKVLVFDSQGNRLPAPEINNSVKFDNPSSLVLSRTKSGKRLYVLNTGGLRVNAFALETRGDPKSAK